MLLLKYDFFAIHQQEQFTHLAHSFLQGKLFFTTIPGDFHDTTYFQGQYYWPLGPFPAILLTPFVEIFGFNMKQGYLLFFLNILNFFLLFKLANKILHNNLTSFWLGFGFIFSTAYSGVALVPWSWYFAQVIAVTLLLLALNEFFFKKRWFLIGIYLALASATRTNLILASTFFILALFFEKQENRIKKVLQLTMPILFTLFLLGAYNFFRFHNFFDQGYLNQLIYGEQFNTRAFGVWNFIHFPANLYYLFLKMPNGIFIPESKVLTFPFLGIDYWGTSIFFTSPLFLWVIKSDFKNKIVRYATLTTIFILFSILGYYGIGFWQYGYRYAIDFYPFLFILLIYAMKKDISFKLIFIIIFSFIINSYFVITIFHPSLRLI